MHKTAPYLARPFPGFIMQLPSSHHHGLINGFSCFLLWELFILFLRWWWSGWGNLTFWKGRFWRSEFISQLRKAKIWFSARKQYTGWVKDGVMARHNRMSSRLFPAFQVHLLKEIPCFNLLFWKLDWCFFTLKATLYAWLPENAFYF